MHDRGEQSTHSPPAYPVRPQRESAGPSRTNSGFSDLSLSDVPQDPNPENCLAHLKLLFTFQTLKNDVGGNDGLWDLWDADYPSVPEDPVMALAKVREKRWALFVARAVDRYESWWSSLGSQMLTERDMEKDRTRYLNFMANWEPMHWREETMPPLDVLLVLHTHMLSPRIFLEDCLRYGHRALWTTGMPWHVLEQMIDSRFQYQASEKCKANWSKVTGRAWYNVDDADEKSTRCPACSGAVSLPWTTCEQPRGGSAKFPPPRPENLTGNGLGDGKLDQRCPRCGIIIDRNLIRLARFKNDVRDLVNNDQPLPGTILDSKSGMPAIASRTDSPRLFPNRFLRRGALAEIVNLMKPGDSMRPSLGMVRQIIDKSMDDQNLLKRANGGRKPSTAERQQIWKTMGRYWDNASPFGIELVGSIIRQGVFTEKMYKIDWLHSSVGQQVMEYLLKRYDHFFQIIVANPDHVVVPTLDIDLAWHTHQLCPGRYYNFSIGKVGFLIDHKDRVDEDKLSEAFEWTTKTYQTMFQQIYSECACWYCEAIRSWRISSFGVLTSTSKQDKIAQAWYDTGAAQAQPLFKAAHISAHAAVKVTELEAGQKEARKARAAYHAKLDQSYSRAVARAARKGRDLGPRELVYHHWGAKYHLDGPWSHPAYLAPELYAVDPAHVETI